MRLRSQKQLYFRFNSPEIDPRDELSIISDLLESFPNYDLVLDKILDDLTHIGRKTTTKGRDGMTAEQVLRAVVIKYLREYSYRKLSHATNDSISVRDFLKIESCKKGFGFKTMQGNIKLLSEITLDMIMGEIKDFAKSQGIEDGKTIRTDGFTTESNIHHPTDWSLLHDSIRVLSRIMTYAHEDLRVPFSFMNHYRSSKSKLFKINNTRSEKNKRKMNLEMIRLCRNTLKYSEEALSIMENFDGCKTKEEVAYLESLIIQLKHYHPLVKCVLEQAYRRIVKEEKVKAEDKIVSIFEDHTDIIVKGHRDIVFGHKSTITTGKSGLVLYVDIHKGNPADSTLVPSVFENHQNFYGNIIEKAVFDGCYASKANRLLAESLGIKHVCFSKESEKESTCSRKMRKLLRNFRAGIEATVSMLKRMFGLSRIMDKGKSSFRKAVKASAITYNLFILARTILKSEKVLA